MQRGQSGAQRTVTGPDSAPTTAAENLVKTGHSPRGRDSALKSALKLAFSVERAVCVPEKSAK